MGKTIFKCIYIGEKTKKSSPELTGLFQSNLIQIILAKEYKFKHVKGQVLLKKKIIAGSFNFLYARL
jgi:hypothetical protein